MSWTTSFPRCWRCGHQSGYHAATFCALMVGTPPGKPCDCTGWQSAAPTQADDIFAYLASPETEKRLAKAMATFWEDDESDFTADARGLLVALRSEP